MRYNSVKLDMDFFKQCLKKRNMSDREFSQAMWKEGTHQTVGQFLPRPNMKIETAMRICNILDISLDDLFRGSDSYDGSPLVVGDSNIINSSIVSHDINDLRKEVRTLKLLLREKDERISELKKSKEDIAKRFDSVLALMSSKHDNHK